MMRRSLLDWFTPPENFHGDFGWVCGFTATPDVVEEMARRFTRGERRRRPALALFAHPSSSFSIRPGVLPLFARPDVAWNFNLLHAKVALLHFQNDKGSLLRLIVSTGNWTHSPMETSIDLYWCAEWNETERDFQTAADITRAASMFEWLRGYFDVRALEVPIHGQDSEAGLRGALSKLPKRALPASRFIDSRTDSLQSQILVRLKVEPVKRSRLIIGSGYFEAGESAETGVLSELVSDIQTAGCATKFPSVDIILNPKACQGLAKQSDELRKRGWTLRPPASIDGFTGAKLHAKFIFSAGGTRRCTKPWCYIGSGNLSRNGFTRAANSGGNLEAGVVFFPEEYMVWGEDPGVKLSDRLPIDLSRSVSDLEPLEAGEEYLPLPAPPISPPVAYLVWDSGMLSTPQGSGEFPDLTVRVPDGNWSSLPVAIPDAPHSALLGPIEVHVPVLTENGFVLPPIGPKRVEDVLFELQDFPRVSADEHDSERATEIFGQEDAPPPHGDSVEYPLRRMMRLIVRLTDRQRSIEGNDWERWTNRVHDLLLALSVSEKAMIDAVRGYGLDPTYALMHPDFLPTALTGRQAAMLKQALGPIRRAWSFEGLEPLFPLETLT